MEFVKKIKSFNTAIHTIRLTTNISYSEKKDEEGDSFYIYKIDAVSGK